MLQVTQNDVKKKKITRDQIRLKRNIGKHRNSNKRLSKTLNELKKRNKEVGDM